MLFTKKFKIVLLLLSAHPSLIIVHPVFFPNEFVFFDVLCRLLHFLFQILGSDFMIWRWLKSKTVPRYHLRHSLEFFTFCHIKCNDIFCCRGRKQLNAMTLFLKILLIVARVLLFLEIFVDVAFESSYTGLFPFTHSTFVSTSDFFLWLTCNALTISHIWTFTSYGTDLHTQTFTCVPAKLCFNL